MAEEVAGAEAPAVAATARRVAFALTLNPACGNLQTMSLTGVGGGGGVESETLLETCYICTSIHFIPLVTGLQAYSRYHVLRHFFGSENDF